MKKEGIESLLSKKILKFRFIFLLFLLRILLIISVIIFSVQPFRWEIFAKWDANFYLQIAKKGYSYSDIAFFPLYPFLIKILVNLLGNYILSGVLISNIFYFLSSILLYKLTFKITKNQTTSQLTTLIFSIFPTSFFTSLIYTESVFFFFTLTLFYYSLKKRWLLSGTAGFLASLTRINGFLNFFPLFSLYYKNKKKWSDIIYVSLPLLGLLTFGVFLYSSFYMSSWWSWWGGLVVSPRYITPLTVIMGDFIKVQENFDRKPLSVEIINDIIFWLKEPITQANLPWKIYYLTSIFFLFFIILMTFYMVYRKNIFPTSLILYTTLNVSFYLLSGSINSFLRYMVPIFPFYIIMGSYLEKAKNKIIIILMLCCLQLLQILFLTFHLKELAVI